MALAQIKQCFNKPKLIIGTLHSFAEIGKPSKSCQYAEAHFLSNIEAAERIDQFILFHT